MRFNPDHVLYLSLALALVLVIGRIVMSAGVTPFSMIRGQGKFDVKASWVSNTAILGAVIAGALKEIHNPEGVGPLNIVFAALALVAPVVYLASVRAFKNEQKEDVCESRVWAYLVSALLALWGGLGQVVTLWQIAYSARSALPHRDDLVVFMGVLIVAAIALLVYAWRAMGQHLLLAVPPPESEDAEAEAMTTAPHQEFSLL